MPYIDITIANEELRKVRMSLKPVNDNYAMGFCEAIKRLNMLPTADVVPKSEVERLEKEVDRLSQVVLYNDGVTQMLVEEAKEKVVREIFEEIDNLFDKYPTLRNIGGAAIAELKKKYTGEQK